MIISRWSGLSAVNCGKNHSTLSWGMICSWHLRRILLMAALTGSKAAREELTPQLTE